MECNNNEIGVLIDFILQKTSCEQSFAGIDDAFRHITCAINCDEK